MTSTSTVNGVAAVSGSKRSVRPQLAASDLQRPLFFSTLVPTDFSAESARVFEQALQLAEENHGSIHLLHVVDKKKLAALERLALLPDDLSLIATAQIELVKFARRGGHPVVPVFTVVKVGDPWREIIRAAREERATLIMLPTHGYKGLKHLMLGSVTERVVRSAHCPVFVVRPPSKTKNPKSRRTQ